LKRIPGNSEGEDRTIIKEEFEKNFYELRDRKPPGADEIPCKICQKQWRKCQKYVI